MKQSELFYQISNYQQENFDHLDITVYWTGDSYRADAGSEMFRISFQADNNFTSWYGGSLHISAGTFETLVNSVAAVKAFFGTARVTSNQNYGEISFSQDVLPALLKVERRVYDDRVSGLLPIEKVLPEDYMAWRDNDLTFCTVGVLARNESEAQQQVLEKLAANGNITRLQAWISAGRPVRRINWEAPKVHPLDTVIKSRWERAAADINVEAWRLS